MFKQVVKCPGQDKYGGKVFQLEVLHSTTNDATTCHFEALKNMLMFLLIPGIFKQKVQNHLEVRLNPVNGGIPPFHLHDDATLSVFRNPVFKIPINV